MCTPPSSVLNKRRRPSPEVDDPYDTFGYPKTKRLCTIGDNQVRNDQLVFPTPSSLSNAGSCGVSTSINTQEEFSSQTLLHDLGEAMMLQHRDDYENSKTDLDFASVTADESEMFEDTNLEALLDNFYHSTDRAASQTPDHIPSQTFSSEYGDQEIHQLFETQDSPTIQYPPSSVIKANDPEARSDEVFDSHLQYSSPKPSSNESNNPSDDSLLSNDIDWKPIHERVRGGTTQSSTQYSKMTNTPRGSSFPTSAQSTSFDIPSQSSEVGAGYQDIYSIGGPLLRPLKTFFGLQEMLDAKTSMFKNQPDAIFELFARVSYSSRENFIHKQHFQFRELIKNSPLYLNGNFSG